MPAPERVAAIVLAAGASTRLGQPKQLVTLRDGLRGEEREGAEPLIRRAARLVLEAGCSPVLVVLGACDQPCRQALNGMAGVRVLLNERWREGMGTTLRAGMAALLRSADHDEGPIADHDPGTDEGPAASVLITVTDQAHVSAGSLARLLAEHRLRVDAPATAAWYGDRPGVPAVFRRALFPALANLGADQGARVLLAQLGRALATVPMPEATFDLDTPEDLRELTEQG